MPSRESGGRPEPGDPTREWEESLLQDAPPGLPAIPMFKPTPSPTPSPEQAMGEEARDSLAAKALERRRAAQMRALADIGGLPAMPGDLSARSEESYTGTSYSGTNPNPGMTTVSPHCFASPPPASEAGR